MSQRQRQSVDVNVAILLTFLLLLPIAIVGSVANPSAVQATGIFPSTAKDRAVIVDGDSGSIEVREWLSSGSGSHSGSNFTSSDTSFSLQIPSSVTQIDALAFGGGGGGAGGTANVRGGGGGGGGEVRRVDDLDVTPGETLSVQVGGAGALGGPNANGGDGGDTFLKRGSTSLLFANGGGGGLRGGEGGTGGSGGSGGVGTLVVNGVDGKTGSANGTSPQDHVALNNSGNAWVISGLRIAAGGGGGGGRFCNSGTGSDFSLGTAVTAAANGFTAASSRIGGQGEGGDNNYPQFFNNSIHAYEFSGSGGGGGGNVFSNSGRGGGSGGAGGLIFSYVLADLDNSSLSASSASMRANSTVQVTLQLKKGSTPADVSAGTVTFALSGPSGTSLSAVTDNADGTYTATLSSGSTEGTATVSASIQGENFADTVAVEVSRLAQTVTWSPPSSQTTLELADAGLTLDAPSTTGDGSFTYSLSDAGSTGCSINSSRVVTFSGAGTCVVTATAAETDTYAEASSNVTLTISIGTFALTRPAASVGTNSSTFTDVCNSSCDISGFSSLDTVLVTITVDTGTLKLATTTGLSAVTGYALANWTSGSSSEIGFTASQSNANTALESLKYKGPSGGANGTLSIAAVVSGAAYDPTTGHYYEVKEIAPSIDWEDARCRAKYGDSSAHDNSAGLTQTDDECTNTGSRRTLNGLNGYLANITTLDEHNFLRTKLTGTGWIGGADLDTEGTFQWVDGPEATQTFFVAGTSTIRTSNTINGISQFNYFSNGEPNNAGGAEDFVEFGFGSDGVGSSWNDCRNTCGSRTKYVIEYGGDGGTVVKEASTSFTVTSPTAPLQVSGTSSSAGNQQITLSWSAPGTGGSAITDYVIEQFDPDTSTWTTLTDGVSTATTYTVTGLTNGTSYSFRISAKNTVGTGSVSATVSATPAVPASSGGSSSGGTTTPVVTPVVTPPSPAIPRILTPPQATPRPTILQGPVTSPGRGFDPSIGTRATIGGAPATVAKRALPKGGVSVQAGALQFGLTLKDPQGSGGVDTNTPSNSPEIRVPSGQSTTFTGGGLLPGSQLQVWLPGRTGEQAKELARVPVKEDGSFDTELSFTARQTETPVPIGRQVMQVAGFDENGNQTVVDMTINVSQGPITPEPNREQGALPDLSIGSSLATSAGIPTPVTVIPLPEERRVAIGDGSWTLQVDVDSESGAVEGTSEAPVIRMVQGTLSSASGDGFMPGTTASVWMFSDPTLMGTVTVAEDGSFTTEFLVDPLFLPAGEHTLQVQGVGEDGFIKAANLGVAVEEPVALTGDASLGVLWWVLGFLVALLTIFFVFFLLRRKRA